uniref:CMP/dCMP-type deaminase domain-containing protein n=1 Tax=Panagrolaimus sp. JU765 TaxID=591449 RepID=A0AC34RIU9_9BILA
MVDVISDFFENDDSIRVLSRKNETTGECDLEFDNAFENMRKYMKFAFDEALEALRLEEVPVGCVFVYENQIIGSGRNRVNEMLNATLHAEIVAIRNAERWCQERNLNIYEVMKKTTLYVNLEPCQMCASAVQLLGIPRIFFGACNDRFGGIVTVGNVYDYVENPATMDLVCGLGRSKTIGLLQAFYCQTNTKAPESKRLRKSDDKKAKLLKSLQL